MAFRPSFHLPAVMLLGIVSQVGQVLLLRELLMVFHGNELAIGLILASWLVWIGIGSRLAAALIHKAKNPYLPITFFVILTVGALPLTIFIIRNLRGFFDILPGAYLTLIDMTLASFMVMAPLCLILGAQFVFLSKAWREHLQTRENISTTSTPSTVGVEKAYIWEAGGNMLGGIIFTFLMVQYLNSFQSAVLVSLLMLIFVLLLNWRRPSHPTDAFGVSNTPNFSVCGIGKAKIIAALLGIIVLIIASFPILEDLDDWAYQLQWNDFSFEHQLLKTHQSKHGTVSVAQYKDQYSFFQSGHLLFSTAAPEVEMPGLEEQDAVDFAHLAMVQHRSPEHILLVGGGLRGTLGEILKYPVETVDYIERDDVLTEAAKPFLPKRTINALEDPRVNLRHGDGRLFIKTAEKNYDMIIVDVLDPVTADLNRYYTKEFYQEIKERLEPEGVFISSIRSTPDLRGPAIANRNTTIYHSLNQIFPQVLPAGEQFMMFFASKSPEHISIDAGKLHQRFKQMNIQAEGFSPHRYHTLLEKSQLQRVNWVVRNHGRSPEAHIHGPGGAPVFPGTIEEQIQKEKSLPPVNESYFVNSDFKPIGYFYSLLFWERLTRGAPSFSLDRLLHIEPWWITPLIIMPIVGTLGLKLYRTKLTSKPEHQQNHQGHRDLSPGPAGNFALLFTVFTTGLSTMALQIALLFSFQSVYGFVYEMVGLITAMFMCGLALGAFLSHSLIKSKVNIKLLTVVQLVMAALAILIATAIPEAARLESPNMIFFFFTLLTLAAGFINGIDFPLAAACYTALNKNADRTSGIIYGTELFGACLGAVLASAAVAPVLGIEACCFLAAFASGTAALILLVTRKELIGDGS